MEEDLSREKIFDMTIQLKGISLLLPENGVLYKLVNILMIVRIYIFIFIDVLPWVILILIV